MSWTAWDPNLDNYMNNNFPECNTVTIATESGDCVCTSRSKDNGPTPTVAEITALANFIKSKSSPDGLQYGNNKLMFTRDIEDSISIFNFKGDIKGAIAACKSASGNFLIIAGGAGADKNSQGVGVQAIRFVEFLKNSL